ncbi:transglutaminase-like domain-containing protein [uncultured Ruminococcus sp.]|uniref:transglutaminase-like domain-containing protein n=1 Tax=uncultured Ruminococcus sp. TaxID=165186 RepID=UPI0025F59007|nr:transglutaminase domain-containing protein [uncultured Ruminococcus sp.]
MELLLQRPVIQRLLRLDWLPMLFASLILTGIMSYYAGDYLPLAAAAAFGTMLLQFKFLDWVHKMRWRGWLVYLAGLILSLYLIVQLILLVESSQQVEFFIWVLTPQSVMEFSGPYSLIIFLLFDIFIGFCVHFFTKIQYRVLASFVLMMFPFLLFGREGDPMPVWLMLLLPLAYFAVMIYCRSRLSGQRAPTRQAACSGTVFLAVTLAFVLVLPKPTVQADRQLIESLLNFDSLTDFLMEQISEFTDSSHVDGFYQNSTKILFYVQAQEPLNLKFKSFTQYNPETDTWMAGEQDRAQDYFVSPDEDPVNVNPALLSNALLHVLTEYPSIAQLYGLDLTGFSDYTLTQTRICSFQADKAAYNFGLTPTCWDSCYASQNTRVTRSDVLYSGSAMRSYQVKYYGQQSQLTELAVYLNRILDQSQWKNLLQKAWSYGEGILPEEESDTLYRAYWMAKYAQDLTEEYTDADAPEIPEGVKTLAQSIVGDATNDLEKVQLLEQYYLGNGFVYDKTYRKSAGENAESFLTVSRRGICFDFATSYVLMCRAVGIPARYVEGFSMTEYGEDGSFVIRGDDAHAFAEVYLTGIGWISVDPTISTEDDSEGFHMDSLTRFIGLMMLGGFALAALLWWLLHRRVAEWWFRRRVFRASSDRGAAMLIARIKKQAQLPDSCTTEELSQRLRLLYQASCDQILSALEQCLYARRPLDKAVISGLYEEYTVARDRIRLVQKEQKKQRTKGDNMELA